MMSLDSPTPPPATISTPAASVDDVGQARVTSGGLAGALWDLSKPRLNSLVVVTTGLGYMLAVAGQETSLAHGQSLNWILHGAFSVRVFLAVCAGTTLLAVSASAFNQRIEMKYDALMDRTRSRPLPAGRISPAGSVVFGIVTGVAGLALLVIETNILVAALGLFSLVIYLAIYTPLKRHTSLNTVVGAVTGAIPPMMGWAAAGAGLEPGAWVLFGILYLWQVPHFLAIAWMYREDYARGGYAMLTVTDPTGEVTATKILLWTAALLPVTFLATVVGLSGWLYLIGAAALGIYALVLGARFYRRRTREDARLIFMTSLVYLPCIFLLMLLDPTTLSGDFIR